jgi:hypothetical protein
MPNISSVRYRQMKLSILQMSLYANLILLLLAVLWFHGVRVFTRRRAKTLSRKGGEPDEILSDWALWAFIKGSLLIILVLIFIMFV